MKPYLVDSTKKERNLFIEDDIKDKKIPTSKCQEEVKSLEIEKSTCLIRAEKRTNYCFYRTHWKDSKRSILRQPDYTKLNENPFDNLVEKYGFENGSGEKVILSDSQKQSTQAEQVMDIHSIDKTIWSKTESTNIDYIYKGSTYVRKKTDETVVNSRRGLCGSLSEIPKNLKFFGIKHEANDRTASCFTEEKDKRKTISGTSHMIEYKTSTQGLANCPDTKVVPLKKRARMFEVPYATGHAFNYTFSKVEFTLEEEFQIVDYFIRIQKYINMRFNFLLQNFPHYDQLLVGFITCTKHERKIPFNKQRYDQLFNLGLEFTKLKTATVFEELGKLSTEVRRIVLNSTYPALYVVFYAILEGNTREKTWKRQHEKTLQITRENHEKLGLQIEALEGTRSIGLKDQDRFTSPWAVNMKDEKKFEKVLSVLGRLLRDDKNLQALYFMLVMMTPSPYLSSTTQVKSSLEQILTFLVFGEET